MTDSDVKPRVPLKQAERKNSALQAPEQTEKLFLSIAKHTGDITMIVDRQGKILYVNRAGIRLAGKDALGKNAFVLLHPESHEQCRQSLDKSIATGKSTVFEHPGPKSTWWLARFIPVTEFGGRLLPQ